MKAWRRSSRMSSSGSQNPGPLVTAIQCDGGTFAFVAFSEPVTVNPGQPTQIGINGDTFTWFAQGGAADALIESATATGHSPGEPWMLAAQDNEAAPPLIPPQFGTTVA